MSNVTPLHPPKPVARLTVTLYDDDTAHLEGPLGARDCAVWLSYLAVVFSSIGESLQADAAAASAANDTDPESKT